MKGSIRRISQGLVAIALLTLVLPFCLCPAGADMGDCCMSGELSLSAACCADASVPAPTLSPAAATPTTPPPSTMSAAAIEPLEFVPVRIQFVLARPIVARTILRI